ncbi:MAG TPA: NAD(P)/FAD-dependent oxidoreductase [Anaerolineales bacterium]|nr:NAD(P)/FAD-dependent oxidoreductase [Anaerolineales bacterium]
MKRYDAVIIGAGPNGLSAAIALAQAGCAVLVLEAKETIGGGCRSAELTLPGFIHDPCATIHSLGVTSPFFRSLPLKKYGLEWIFPPASLAHPLDDGSAVILERSVEKTSQSLGEDGKAYQRLFSPLVENWGKLSKELLGPVPIPPRHPLLLARFGLIALRPAASVAAGRFKGKRAQALFAGLGAHSIQPLDNIMTAAFGLMLGTSAHAAGWPVARGGSQMVVNALAQYLVSLGGEIATNHPVKSQADLPDTTVALFDVAPKQLLEIMGDRLPDGYRERLKRYRYGPGVFKVDFALDGPIPWKAADCLRAATAHLGGTLEEIIQGERAVGEGEHPQHPFVLLAQQTLFDPRRAPDGKHTVWAYCHVPNGSTVDMTERIEAQIERFAPGFRDRIIAKATRSAVEIEAYNPNYIGGDINGGVQDLTQHFTRPTARIVPYSTPLEGIYLCSSSTPPGGGVHGMSGYFAAKAALSMLGKKASALIEFQPAEAGL